MANANAGLVSVIVPCYNQAQFLGEAVESILRQRGTDFEVIVVDDGSTDQTAEIARRYAGVRLVRQRNQGPSAARNFGAQESRGEYLVFLDADDRLLPGALAGGRTALTATPECGFVSGHYRLIQADGGPLPACPSPCAEGEHFAALLRGNYIGMLATVMYRRSAFEQVGGFATNLPACEDYDLYLRIAEHLPTRCHHLVAAEYRQHEANLSRNAALMLKTSLDVLRAHRRAARRLPELRRAYKAGVNRWQAYYGKALIKQIKGQWQRNEWRDVWRGALTLLRYHPREFINQAGRQARLKVAAAPKQFWARLLGQG